MTVTQTKSYACYWPPSLSRACDTHIPLSCSKYILYEVCKVIYTISSRGQCGAFKDDPEATFDLLNWGEHVTVTHINSIITLCPMLLKRVSLTNSAPSTSPRIIPVPFSTSSNGVSTRLLQTRLLAATYNVYWWHGLQAPLEVQG